MTAAIAAIAIAAMLGLVALEQSIRWLERRKLRRKR
jgi:ABC-type nitrate/sulfonate/bicarbonate transport system permease component